MSSWTRLKRLEKASAGGCPNCWDWPDTIQLRIVEQIIEPGEEVPPPDRRDHTLFHCEACGRTHRPKVVELVRDPNFYQNRGRLEEVQNGHAD